MMASGGNEQQLIEAKAKAFLKSRKNANDLVDIVSILEVSSTFIVIDKEQTIKLRKLEST